MLLARLGSRTILNKMSIKAALIDLSGTLHVEDNETPGSVEALERLRKTGIQIKFVTNTTKESSQTLYDRLIKIGFKLEKEEIYSSLSAARDFVKDANLKPFYLLSEDAKKDFPPQSLENECNSVVVGLAPESFHYECLNKAFNILLKNKEYPLVAVHQGKYYKRNDGLALGPGCFVKGLEYVTGKNATVIGKPNRYFFEKAVPDGIQIGECVMIGDDANDDVAGAMNIGMKAILVKTGKYLPDAEIPVQPTALLDNFASAVKWIENYNII
ncbi:haloacid dehalogenase-like hydrolase domain-containing protein 2 [Condylostylus longicornis]|uniref:haloacid dehalogenase-like hydrolase domain-containing protein 2 n=1 Tax=Condylostylus longicornis TaxID=2530218 RepID=UPI00244DD938|nr:haloacid dehalogenase-like hydrolase domain-containing protein 2 [Condylostylus longicornis]